MSKNVYVFAEQRDGVIQSVAYELVGEAANLAEDLKQKVVAVLLGDQITDQAEDLIAHGADEVVVIDHPTLAEYMTEPYAKALTQVVRDEEPEIVLFGATSIGRDLAPRISARVKTGLTADCTALALDPQSKLLRMTRPAFGGNLMAVILCKNHRPQMATVRPGVMQPMEKDTARKGIVRKVECDLSAKDQTVEILEVIRQKKKIADITQAKYIVSGGRGMGGKENFAMLRELAGAIGGEVAASRGAVDLGWMEKDLQVGQTGKTVRPELYFACGISGAIQHVAGMENSQVVIAVNKNDTAPIFDVADLGVVGDIHVILPKLIEAVKAAKVAGIAYVAPDAGDVVGMKNVLYNVQNGIAWLTINRPKSLNALNKQTLIEIGAVADKVREDASVKVLVVRGAGGRAFVAGADITEMQDMNEEEGRAIAALGQSTFNKLASLPQIVIAAVNGYALGGGNELAMACDIRIASNRAKFGQPEVNLGVIPGFGGTQRLSRLVGKGYAKEIIFTADMISAEEAYRIGLVNKVVAPEALMRTVQNIAMKLMSKGMFAIKQAKQAINNGVVIDLDQGLDLEADKWTECFATYDQKEGMAAFVEKRKPSFKDF